MAQHQLHAPHRLRAPLAAMAALVLATSGLIATTAAAAPVGDCAAGFAASTQTEWLDALDAAADCATDEVTITLADSISLDASANSADPYFGTADLTVDGGGQTVTLDGAYRFLYVPTASTGAVDVRHLSLQGTGVNSFLFITQVDRVSLHDVSVTGSGNYGILVDDAETVTLTELTGEATTMSTSALYVSDATSVTLTDATLTGATGSGAGVVRLQGTQVSVTDALFEGNTVSGPAVLNLNGDTVAIAGSRFVDNSSTSSGGVVVASGGSFEITPSATQDSYFEGNTTSGPGGALFSGASTTTIDTVIFRDNESTGSIAGAVYAGTLSIVDSEFINNTAVSPGGAVYGSTTDITRTTFVNNTSSGSNGGAVYAGNTTITDSDFRNNSASSPGGAVSASNVEVTASTFDNNHSTGSIGGAISGQAVTVTDSTFTDNSAVNPGGAIYSSNTTSIDASTFVGNVTTQVGNPGGALYSAGAATVRNSTFVDNATAYRGGAISAGSAGVTIGHSTFRGNSADTAGSHVQTNGNLTTYGTVYADALGGSDACLTGTTTSDGYNFDDTGDCTDGHTGTADIDSAGVDPMLGDLADHQGPTHTLLPLTGSPLIDAIPTATCALAITADADLEYGQRGVERPQGDGCDIGAVETLPDLTFTIAADSGPIQVTVTDALSYDCVTWETATGYSPTPPADMAFPHGIFGYCFELPGEGWSIDLTLDLPSPVTQLWKVGGGDWRQITDASYDGTTVSYSITDGDALDEDGSVNGEIIDPVAPGIGAGFTG